MKNIIKIAVLTGSFAPFIASAQLVSNGAAETASDGTGSLFHQTVNSMSGDVNALFDPEGDSIALGSDIYWDGSNFSGTSTGSSSEIRFQDVSPSTDFFRMEGNFSIGYFGNESDHDNELYMRVSENADGTGAQQYLHSTVDGGLPLFDYDSGDPNSNDDPPMSYTFNLDQDVDEAYVQYIHKNQNTGDLAYQDNPDRFKLFAELDSSNDFTGKYIMAIGDQNQSYDSDWDDGFFYLEGSITPVPEPSHIAALALMGLGATLIVRRRIRKNKA